MTSRAYGIFGGTFDPVHIGHRALADQVVKALGLERLYLIPTYLPPHKEWVPFASYDHRRMMLQLAMDAPHFVISDMEQERGGLSYSIETIRAFRRAFPQESSFFITGADAYASFMDWHSWKDIFEETVVVMTTRPGYDFKVNPEIEEAAYRAKGGLMILGVDTPDLSSTQVRNILGDEKTRAQAKAFLPPGVYEYIEDQNLYKGDANRLG